MKKALWFFLLISFLPLSYPQEVGVAPVKIWSDNYELQNPWGFGFYYFQKIWKTGIKLEYITAKNEREYFGSLSTGFFSNPEILVPQRVKSNSYYRAFEISLVVPKVFEYNQFNLNLLFGLTFDKYEGDRIGLSTGRKTVLFSENKTGLIYGVSIARNNLFGIPLKAELLFKQKVLGGNITVIDAEQTFGGGINIKELQLNLSYSFIR